MDIVFNYRITFGKKEVENETWSRTLVYLFGNSSQSVDVVIFEIILLLL